MKENCENCAFFHQNDDDKQTFCRRYPPTAFPVANVNNFTRRMDVRIGTTYPPVLPDQYCGEYEEKDGMARIVKAHIENKKDECPI